MLTTLGINALVVLAAVSLLWVLSIFKRDVSIVDPFWAPLFAIITASTLLQSSLSPAKVLLAAMVFAWAARLGGYLLWRNWGQPEDFRYVAFRKHYGVERYWWFSFFQVFLLQGALAFVVSAPLQLAALSTPPDAIGLFDIAGALVFALGFVFEAGGDYQLLVFKRNPENKGKLLTTGLWAWTRHPNYFGNAAMWWGFGLCALDAGPLWGALAFLGPLLMTFLLLRVSGVSLLDKHLAKTKPGFEAYVANTPAFFPRPPR
jgi:steroid 5-alpha reductase family enzyme